MSTDISADEIQHALKLLKNRAVIGNDWDRCSLEEQELIDSHLQFQDKIKDRLENV